MLAALPTMHAPTFCACHTFPTTPQARILNLNARTNFLCLPHFSYNARTDFLCLPHFSNNTSGPHPELEYTHRLFVLVALFPQCTHRLFVLAALPTTPQARILLVDGDHRVAIFAAKHIAPGDELFYNYRYGTQTATQAVKTTLHSGNEGGRGRGEERQSIP